MQAVQKAAPVLEEAEAQLSGTSGDAAPEWKANGAQLENGQVAGNCCDRFFHNLQRCRTDR